MMESPGSLATPSTRRHSRGRRSRLGRNWPEDGPSNISGSKLTCGLVFGSVLVVLSELPSSCSPASWAVTRQRISDVGLAMAAVTLRRPEEDVEIKISEMRSCYKQQNIHLGPGCRLQL